MKKIVIVDGGPRKNMNTAQLLQRFAEGAKSVSEDVEVDDQVCLYRQLDDGEDDARLYAGSSIHCYHL